MNKTYLKWDHVRIMCEVLVKNDLILDPDVIVPVIRGGMIPGTILSHLFKCNNVIPITLQTRDVSSFKYNNILDEYKNSKVLIVDDIVDSGETFNTINRFLTSKDFKHVQYAALIGKTVVENCILAEMVSTQDWVVFPWE